MIPTYVLGTLMRFGAQHGYQLKKIINESASDFADIKLPNVYYHLEKMEKSNLLISSEKKEGSRPSKTVYQITDKGKEEFLKGLEKLLAFDYRPTFDLDAVFFFSEYADKKEIISNLKKHIKALENSIVQIERHKEESLPHIPENMRTHAEVIFNHHLTHYNAEKKWAKNTLKALT